METQKKLTRIYQTDLGELKLEDETPIKGAKLIGRLALAEGCPESLDNILNMMNRPRANAYLLSNPLYLTEIIRNRHGVNIYRDTDDSPLLNSPNKEKWRAAAIQHYRIPTKYLVGDK